MSVFQVVGIMIGGGAGALVKLLWGETHILKRLGFKSQHHKLEVHFFTFICCKN